MTEPARVENVSKVRVLAFCGVSLLIEGIRASLQDLDGVEIVMLDASRSDALQVLDQLNPDILVFDLTPIQLICVLNFLRNHTKSVLIGLDIDTDKALVLSGEWLWLPTMADIIQVIEARIQLKNERSL